MSGVALNRAKEKAHLSSEAKTKVLLGATIAQVRREANSALLKVTAQLNSTRLASYNEAKALMLCQLRHVKLSLLAKLS